MAHINKCIEDLLRKSNYFCLVCILSKMNSFMIWICSFQCVHISFFCDLFSFFISIFVFIVGGKKAVEVTAPTWVPDNEATVCMHCKKTQFTVWVRRVSLLNILFWNDFDSINNKLRSLFHHFVLPISASLSKLRSGSLWSMFIEEIFATATEYKAFTCLFRLLWFT